MEAIRGQFSGWLDEAVAILFRAVGSSRRVSIPLVASFVSAPFRRALLIADGGERRVHDECRACGGDTRERPSSDRSLRRGPALLPEKIALLRFPSSYGLCVDPSWAAAWRKDDGIQ